MLINNLFLLLFSCLYFHAFIRLVLICMSRFEHYTNCTLSSSADRCLEILNELISCTCERCLLANIRRGAAESLTHNPVPESDSDSDTQSGSKAFLNNILSWSFFRQICAQPAKFVGNLLENVEILPFKRFGSH